MGQWYYTEIFFTGPIPNEDQLVRLNQAFRAVDHDFPPITVAGVERNWRNPSLTLEQALGLFERAGFPCKGWQVYEGREVYTAPDYIASKLDMCADLMEFDSQNWREAYERGLTPEEIAKAENAERTMLLRNYFFEQSLRMRDILKVVDPEDKEAVEKVAKLFNELRDKYGEKMKA
jgi:hypothetical protein